MSSRGSRVQRAGSGRSPVGYHHIALGERWGLPFATQDDSVTVLFSDRTIGCFELSLPHDFAVNFGSPQAGESWAESQRDPRYPGVSRETDQASSVRLPQLVFSGA